MALWVDLDYRLIGEAECRINVDRRRAAERYDLLLACVGYEARSSYLPLKMAGYAARCIASAFDSNQTLSFPENLSRLSGARFDIHEHRDGEIRSWLFKQILDLPVEIEQPAAIAVDVSSFSRSRIAEIILALCDAGSQRELAADLFYAPSRYQKHEEGDETITIAEPVAYEVAGWPTAPELPVAGIVGLGYEPGRAVGIAEYLDADRLWGCVPTGTDSRYDESVEQANRLFWVDPRTRRVIYDVSDPFLTFVQLESLTYGLADTHRVVLVPFGPKIFAVCSLMVGLLYPATASVWRVSAGAPARPVNQWALGVSSMFSLRIAPCSRRVA
jgi:hypothetical protein